MLVKSVNLLPASIKSMNPMQKYPHNIGLFECTRKMLAINKAFQCVPTSAYLSRFITYVPSFIF